MLIYRYTRIYIRYNDIESTTWNKALYGRESWTIKKEGEGKPGKVLKCVVGERLKNKNKVDRNGKKLKWF